MMPLRFENIGFIFSYNLNLRENVTYQVRASKISDLAFGGIPYQPKNNYFLKLFNTCYCRVIFGTHRSGRQAPIPLVITTAFHYETHLQRGRKAETRRIYIGTTINLLQVVSTLNCFVMALSKGQVLRPSVNDRKFYERLQGSYYLLRPPVCQAVSWIPIV